jgi:hypothetical protein
MRYSTRACTFLHLECSFSTLTRATRHTRRHTCTHTPDTHARRHTRILTHTTPHHTPEHIHAHSTHETRNTHKRKRKRINTHTHTFLHNSKDEPSRRATQFHKTLPFRDQPSSSANSLLVCTGSGQQHQQRVRPISRAAVLTRPHVSMIERDEVVGVLRRFDRGVGLLGAALGTRVRSRVRT